jgi:sugar phosphate isomerase/epimerase
LHAEGIKYLEFRGVWDQNVLLLPRPKLQEFRRMLDDAGIAVSAIGSPVGKIKISEPFGPELDRFKWSLEVADLMAAPWVRIFSYYPPEGGRIDEHRQEVLSRMKQKVAAANGATARLFSENESDLYGESAAHCLEIIEHCGGAPYLQQCFDPANFVYNGLDPWQAWEVLRDVTGYFHIKDVTWPPERRFTPAGEGNCRIPEILRDAIVNRGYDGFLSLEPHLTLGGRMAGFSGPDLFKSAARGLKKVLADLGAKYE